ncbi:MAG: diguanylate cyclase [Acidimicrobiales bacterium]
MRAETLLPAKPAVKPRELWLRGGFDQASIGLAIIDREGQIRLVNGAFTNLSGLPKSKVVGTRLPDLLEPPSSEVVQQWCLAPVQPATFEVTVQRASASPLEAVLLVSPLSGGGATGHTLVQLVPAALSPTTREELARFHGVIDHIDDLIVTTRADGTITFVSASTQRATGRDTESLVGSSFFDLVHPEDRVAITSARRKSRSPVLEIAVRIASESGWSKRHLTVTEIRDQLDQLLGIAYVGATAATSSELSTDPAEDRFDDLFASTPDCVWRFDMTGPASANPAARKLLGLGATEPLEGLGLLEIHPRWVVERIAKHGVPETRAGRSWTADLALLDRDGEEIPVSLVLIGHPDPSGRVDRWTSISRPVTGDRTAAELRWAATHDHLTGLPGRVLMYDRIEVALARANRTGQRVGLLLLDLDFFDVVNESVGVDIADRMLKALAERLVLSIRPGDSIGRMGEDEFVVLCDHFDHIDDAERFAERLMRVVEEPVELDGAEWFVSMSVGIAVARHGVTNVDGLMRSADAAMYRAKELGRGRHVVFGNTLSTPRLPFAPPD